MKKITINKLSSEQAAYLAGIIDGEGSIGLISGRIRLKITQAEKGKHVLYLLKDWIGAGSVGLHRKSQGNWQAVYNYRIHSTKGIALIFSQIKPYLVIKKESFERLLN